MEKLEYIKFILDRSAASEINKGLVSDWLQKEYGDKNKCLFSYSEFKHLMDWFILNQRQFYVVPHTNKSRKVTFN